MIILPVFISRAYFSIINPTNSSVAIAIICKTPSLSNVSMKGNASISNPQHRFSRENTFWLPEIARSSHPHDPIHSSWYVTVKHFVGYLTCICYAKKAIIRARDPKGRRKHLQLGRGGGDNVSKIFAMEFLPYRNSPSCA